MSAPDRGVFTTGSTMRHVAVMTATGAVGLMALFLVDAVNLFYISILGVTELAAAIGYAGALQFFMLSISIGLMIGGVALVSRAIGAGDVARARELAASSMAGSVVFLTVLAGVVWIWRDEALALVGAEGEAKDLASDFLAIALLSVPLIGVGMGASATLRAKGAARDAMYVTLSGGLFAAVVDPLLIFGLDLGLTGAAIAIVLTRLASGGVGLWLVVRRHGMIARPTFRQWLIDIPRLIRVAGPAMATQLSTPFGMAYLTATVAESGDEAVAGWAVIGRITALAFGGIFSLAGAVGPIIGQNYGARIYARVALAYRDGLIFTALYVSVAWLVLWLSTDLIVWGFDLHGGGAEILATFTAIGAGGYLFHGALFVSNAAFNNLGRPLWSTVFNWTRDGVLVPTLAYLAADSLGVGAAVYMHATAGLVAGSAAALTAWRLVHHIRDAGAEPMPTAVPTITGGRAAEAGWSNPLASSRESR